MATLHDDEFGQIVIRRSKLSSSLKLSVAPDGTLRISMPRYAPMFLAKKLIQSSRDSVRELRQTHHSPTLVDRMQIGKSHRLVIREGAQIATSYQRSERIILLTVPPNQSLHESAVINAVVPVVIAIFRREAKSYLPKRLKFLANSHGFDYKKVRFSHASTRWGSCSSSGTISLNIALMRLDFELIDYVLIHELCHTKQMNHSPAFWKLVEECDPDYRQHRKLLKATQPFVL